MLISEFVKKYKEETEKEKLLASIVTRKYISYNTKVDESRKIIKITSYKDINGKETFILNSPMRYIFFVVSIIEQYTNLEFDKIAGSEINDVSRDIDLFEEYNITKKLFHYIGEDIDAFTTILNLVLSDEMENYRSIVPVLESKMEALNLVMDNFIKAFEDPRVKDNVIKFISNKQ